MRKSIIIKFSEICILITGFICLVSSYGCSASTSLNDFFGIQMPEESAGRFKIVAYDERSGASYYSDEQMNANLYGWAEIDIQRLYIKIVNNTSDAITFNYNKDVFLIETVDGNEYVLIKGERLDYPGEGRIRPGHSVQFVLGMPQDYWKTVGLSDADASDPNYLTDFWQGENSLNLVKQSIIQMKIKLAGQTTIILKPIPAQ
jgi:hypothetical protein